MLIRVNKKISTPSPVTYAAMALGTTSDVWSDEETDSSSKPKRRNHIRVTREVLPQQPDA